MKKKIHFVCQNCGAEHSRWQGKCSECTQWNTLVEEFQEEKKISWDEKLSETFSKRSEIKILDDFLTEETDLKRISCGFPEVDRVLGGGFVPGSFLLFGGEPGIGKSTLLLQILSKLAQKKLSTLYVSGEESGHQVAARAQRLKLPTLPTLKFFSCTSIEEYLSAVKKTKPQILVIDSVQTFASSEIQSSPGTVSQVRAVAQSLLELAKFEKILVLLVGQITKEGSIAGPKLLEHMVDGVFYFDLLPTGSFRSLRAQKNRFGPANEIVVFEMRERGLDEIPNPSERFLMERARDMPGSAIVSLLEGTRPLMTEVQALSQKCFFGLPRRTTQGIDQNRVSVLLAVIEKILRISFSDKDVYCKVASGIQVNEPAADLALLFSLVSTALNCALPADLLLLGEVGLGGELRSIGGVTQRLKEAASVGVRQVVLPVWNAKEVKDFKEFKIHAVKNISQVKELLFKNVFDVQSPGSSSSSESFKSSNA